jgi:hypothetical protein
MDSGNPEKPSSYNNGIMLLSTIAFAMLWQESYFGTFELKIVKHKRNELLNKGCVKPTSGRF